MKRLLTALILLTSVGNFYAQQTGGGGGVPGGGGGTASLPAGSVGQSLFNSTGSTTYVAATNPGLLNFPNFATAASPLYLEAHFRDDAQDMFLSYSADAKNYVQLDATPAVTGPSGGVRDIGAIYVPATSTFYFAGTCCNNGTFAYWTSANLQTFSSVTTLTAPGVGTTNWSPHFFQDGQSSNYYMVIGGCPSACTTANTFYLATFTPSTGTFGTFNAITLNGESGDTGIFDARILWDAANSTYYMVYAAQTSATPTQYIHIATATSIGGPYTRINSGTTDYFGFGSQSENPDLIVLPGGNVRVSADTWTSFASSRFYTREYVDTSGNFGTVIGTPALINGPEQEGGTNITITSPAVAGIVYAAAEIQPNPVNFPLSKIGVNGAQNSAYSIFINNWAYNGNPNAFDPSGIPAIGMQIANGSITTLSSNAPGTFLVGQSPGDQTGTVNDGTTNSTTMNSTTLNLGVTGIGGTSGQLNWIPFGTTEPTWNSNASNGANLLEFTQTGTGAVAGFPLLIYGASFSGNNALAGIDIESASGYQWNSTTTGGTVDTSITRPAAGTACIGTPTALCTGGFEFGQLRPQGTVPTMAAGAAAGTSPTCTSVTGTNTSFTLSCTTGTSTTASATLATITFNGTLAVAPQGCTLYPRNAATGLQTAAIYTTAPSTTSFTIAVGATALTASTAYVWSGFCI